MAQQSSRGEHRVKLVKYPGGQLESDVAPNGSYINFELRADGRLVVLSVGDGVEADFDVETVLTRKSVRMLRDLLNGTL